MLDVLEVLTPTLDGIIEGACPPIGAPCNDDDGAGGIDGGPKLGMPNGIGGGALWPDDGADSGDGPCVGSGADNDEDDDGAGTGCAPPSGTGAVARTGVGRTIDEDG